ncbi:MAG: ADP-glyceromanno-heptose 6-epimerase [Magnetococcales bacterium]|nr:ADP-glyceromanno-heptose 6-epimerase [Magnetococcales bacterium]
MFIVTGGAGFIGSNIVAGLNRRGKRNILVVDNLESSEKFLNLRDLQYADYMDKREFRMKLQNRQFDTQKVSAIFHQGACSDTMEYDGRYMMDNNFTYSKELLNFASRRKIPFIYASSAAVYGAESEFLEHPRNEKPLNVYGYSKLLFDQYVKRQSPKMKQTVVGLRYFNVYGPREQHKGRMASQAFQLYNQINETGTATLFEGSGGYGNGDQRRDFVYVEDAVKINLYLAARKRPLKGVLNVGTGESRSFNAIARGLGKIMGSVELRYRAMPEGLKEKYQSFTEADITRLRRIGYTQPFTSLEDGLAAYVKHLRGA